MCTRPVIIQVHLASLLYIIFEVDWCDDGKEMEEYGFPPHSPIHLSSLTRHVSSLRSLQTRRRKVQCQAIPGQATDKIGYE